MYLRCCTTQSYYSMGKNEATQKKPISAGQAPMGSPVVVAQKEIYGTVSMEHYQVVRNKKVPPKGHTTLECCRIDRLNKSTKTSPKQRGLLRSTLKEEALHLVNTYNQLEAVMINHNKHQKGVHNKHHKKGVYNDQSE